MASHRAQLLLTLLPTALAFGMQDVEPDIELLKVWLKAFCVTNGLIMAYSPTQNLDTDMPINCPDTDARFFAANVEHSEPKTREEVLDALLTEWDKFDSRQHVPDTQWAEELTRYLEDLAEMRVNHVRAWFKSNLTRFQAGHASVVEIQRTLENAVIDLKSSVQLCRMQCGSCQLFCIQGRSHDGAHNCKTMHRCTQLCEFCVEARELEEEEEEEEEEKRCTMTQVVSASQPNN